MSDDLYAASATIGRKNPLDSITLNVEQQLYVIRLCEGYGTFGFKNARDDANQIAALLKRDDLAFTDADFGTLDGYRKHEEAVRAWAHSPMSKQTWFQPGTDPKAAKALERCRRACNKIRLILGSLETGVSWMNEHDIVGTVGRSLGPLRVPLLVEENSDCGDAISTDRLLALIDWRTGKFLYRHPAYRIPNLTIRRQDDPKWPWEVLHDSQVVARFKNIGKAGAYVAFMCGESIEPRIFQ
jgi:hypothetical protein